MTKKIIIFSFIIFPVYINTGVCADKNVQLFIKYGEDVLGRQSSTLRSFYIHETAENAPLYGGELYVNIGNVDAGIGYENQLRRGLSISYGEFHFRNIYFLMRYFPQQILNKNKLLYYLTWKLGYNTFHGDRHYTDDYELKGGMYYGVGGGIDIFDAFQIELCYSINHGNRKNRSMHLFPENEFIDVNYSYE